MRDPREVYQELMDELRSAGPVMDDVDSAWRQNGQLCCAMYAVAAELRGLRLDLAASRDGIISEPAAAQPEQT